MYYIREIMLGYTGFVHFSCIYSIFILWNFINIGIEYLNNLHFHPIVCNECILPNPLQVVLKYNVTK